MHIIGYLDPLSTEIVHHALLTGWKVLEADDQGALLARNTNEEIRCRVPNTQEADPDLFHEALSMIAAQTSTTLLLWRLGVAHGARERINSVHLHENMYRK